MEKQFHTEYGPWEVMDRVANGGSFQEEVAAYIGGHDLAYQHRLREGFATVTATPAFYEVKNMKVAVAGLISFQEEHHIRQALGTYARQEEPPPYRALGYLNWPEFPTQHKVDATQAVLDEFIADHPEVPFGYYKDQEPGPLVIGRLRKRTDETLLVGSLPDIEEDGDVLVLNHDADMVDMSPTHLRDLNGKFRSKPGITGVIPWVSHRRTPPTLTSKGLPNMDQLIVWMDDWEVQCERGKYYEPGPGFSARAYMAVGGYDPARTHAETHDVMARIHQDNPFDHPGCLLVPEARLVLSPRRFYTKFYQSYGPDQIWRMTEDDFTTEDNYRAIPEAVFGQWPDMPQAAMEQHARRLGVTIMHEVYLRQLIRGAEVADAAQHTLEVTRRLHARLGGPRDMFSEGRKAFAGMLESIR